MVPLAECDNLNGQVIFGADSCDDVICNIVDCCLPDDTCLTGVDSQACVGMGGFPVLQCAPGICEQVQSNICCGVAMIVDPNGAASVTGNGTMGSPFIFPGGQSEVAGCEESWFEAFGNDLNRALNFEHFTSNCSALFRHAGAFTCVPLPCVPFECRISGFNNCGCDDDAYWQYVGGPSPQASSVSMGVQTCSIWNVSGTIFGGLSPTCPAQGIPPCQAGPEGGHILNNKVIDTSAVFDDPVALANLLNQHTSGVMDDNPIFSSIAYNMPIQFIPVA